jgi:metallo-beta-lactamase family protein
MAGHRTKPRRGLTKPAPSKDDARMTTLSFYGATGTVTGSKYLLEHRGFRMLVDCGLFQGLKDLRLRNWAEPPFEAKEVDLVLLTHAHLDHTGWLPRLLKFGYPGRVVCTPATRDLCGIILPDSGHLQEEDARYLNWRGASKHKPALPLYTEADAREALERIDPHPWSRPLQVHDDVTVRFLPAGHIVGAAFIEVVLRKAGKDGGDRTIVFSGDLGRNDQPILPDPSTLPACDHLLLESTYGNRDHPSEDPKEVLLRVAMETIQAGGTLLIPSFAVGRTQHLLWLLRELRHEGRLPTDVPIYMDSPMAIEATRITLGHPEAVDREMRQANSHGADPLGLENGVKCATTVEDSKRLNDVRYPAIIISASGMAEGGRILHHLFFKLPDHRTTVLFVGYQGIGTRGRALQDGVKEIRMHGRTVPVRARIETIDGLSAHADRGEILRWLKGAEGRPGGVHLVHGEPDARDALARLLEERQGIAPHRPDYAARVDIA